jgi:hypothetical protein
VTNDDFENAATYRHFVRVNLAARAEIQVPFSERRFSEVSVFGEAARRDRTLCEN